jgi:hypothetical protein
MWCSTVQWYGSPAGCHRRSHRVWRADAGGRHVGMAKKKSAKKAKKQSNRFMKRTKKALRKLRKDVDRLGRRKDRHANH